jgi:hypothetical protein
MLAMPADVFRAEAVASVYGIAGMGCCRIRLTFCQSITRGNPNAAHYSQISQ